MRIVFVNRYFHPDHSATSQMASDLAFHLQNRGWDVAAISSRQRYDEPEASLPSRSIEQGVEVRRVWSSRFGRANLLGRAVDYATFYVSAFLAMLREGGRGTVLVALTDPPLLSVAAALAANLRGTTLVNWTQDLFPEVARALGVRAPRILERLRDWSLRRARTNVALGELMADRIRGRGAQAIVQHNWATDALQPVARETNPLRSEWALGDRFVAGYSGNLGRAHEFEAIAGAVRAMPDVAFLFIGAGAQLERVQRETAGAANVTFRPYQTRRRLSDSLSVADVHLVSLQPALEGLIVPSKFYGILAVARPVIFIGASGGELARLIGEHGCGLVVAPGDADGLAEAIRRLAADPALAADMGRRGRALYEARFAPELALAGWEHILQQSIEERRDA
ncbi:MAG: putative colanic acid biosynthesis glycosyl transferase [Acidobacteria bacterium]|nr:putative colanic acid biosynthesis glycosyl transferase [Acidobacteriota bacterium]